MNENDKIISDIKKFIETIINRDIPVSREVFKSSKYIVVYLSKECYIEDCNDTIGSIIDYIKDCIYNNIYQDRDFCVYRYRVSIEFYNQNIQ